MYMIVYETQKLIYLSLYLFKNLCIQNKYTTNVVVLFSFIKHAFLIRLTKHCSPKHLEK